MDLLQTILAMELIGDHLPLIIALLAITIINVLLLWKMRRRSAALSTLNQQLNLILKLANDGINIVKWTGKRRKLEMCNDRYAEIAGRSRKELFAAENLNEFVKNHRTAEEDEEVRRQLREGVPVRGLSSWIRPDGRENYYEWTAVSTKINGELHIVGVDRDVTERERDLGKVHRQLELQKAISAVSSLFISIADVKEATAFALSQMCKFTGAARSYIYLMNPDGQALTKAYDWAVPDCPMDRPLYQEISLRQHPWLSKMLREKRGICFQDISEMPPEAQAERETLKSLGVTSVLNLPLEVGDKVIGFMGYHNMANPAQLVEDNVSLVRVFSHIISSALERHRVEEALRQSESQLRLIMENASDGINIIEMDPQTGQRQLITCNGRYVEMSGRTREELFSAEQTGLFTRTEMAEEEAEIRRQQCLGQPTRGTASWVRADGKENWYEWTATPLRVNGKLHLIGVDRDVTERELAWRQLRRRLEFEKVISTISAGFIGDTDLDEAINFTLEQLGILTGVGRAYVHLISSDGEAVSNTHEWCAKGVSREKVEFKRTPLKDFPWWADHLMNNKALRITDVSKLPPEAASEKHNYEWQGVKSALALPLMVKGKPIGMIGFDNVDGPCEWTEDDISLLQVCSRIVATAIDRKHVEVALRESEHRMRLVLEHASDGINISEVSPDFTRRRVIVCNDRYVEMSGRTREEILAADNVNAFLHVGRTPEQVEEGHRKVAAGEPISGTSSWIRLDGKENWYEWAAAPIWMNGKLHLIGIDRDVTERELAWRQLNRRLEFEKVISSVSARFIGNTDLDEAINAALAQLGAMTHVARAYIHLMHGDDKFVGNTHEWCAEGVPSMKAGHTHTPLEWFPWWADHLLNNKVLRITDVSKLPPEAAKEKAVFEAQAVKSVLALPLMVKDKPIGIVGFDNIDGPCEWTEDDVSLLQIASRILSTAIDRKRIEDALRESEHRMRLVLENANEGINICELTPGGKRLVMCNDRFVELTGRTREELFAAPDVSAFADADANPGEGKDFALHMKQGEGMRGLVSWLRPDGKRNCCEWTGAPIRMGERVLVVGIDRDVMERIEAEEALRESEKRMRLVLEHASDGINICEMDPEGQWRRLVMCNDRFVEMSGRTREELFAAPDLNKLITGGTELESVKGRRRRLRDGDSVSGLCSWIRPDGKRNVYEWSAAPIQTEGRLLVVGVDRDVTERIESEEALRASEQRMRAVLENASDGINICEIDQKTLARRLVMCNDRFVEMSGRTREELFASPDLNKLTAAQVECEDGGKPRLVRGNRDRGLSSWIRPDGKRNFYEWTAAPIETGERLVVVGVDRDVTERIESEEALRASEKRMRLVLENASDGINICELDRKTLSRRLIMCNDRFVEMSGRTREELFATPDLNQFTTAQIHHEGNGQPPLVEGNQDRGCCSWIRPDGKRNHYEWTAAPIENGERLVVVGVDRDVTERMEAEEALRESEHRMRLVLQNASDGINICEVNRADYSRRLIMCNDRFVEMSGRTREELFAAPDMNQFTTAQIWGEGVGRHPLAQGDRDRGLCSWIRPDGKRNFYEWTAAPIENGERLIVVGVDRDVTEKMESEEALRQSEELLSSIIDQSPVSTWIADQEGTNIRQNDACRKLFGIERDEQTVGKYNLFKDPILLEQGHVEKIRAVFTEGKPCRFITRYDLSRVGGVAVKESRTLDLFVSIFPIRDAQGKVVNAVIQHEDLTARRQAEEALRAERDFASSLVENAQAIVLVLNMNAHCVSLNQYGQQLLGYTQQDLADKDWIRTVIPPEEQPRLAKVFARGLAGESLRRVENLVLTKDGRRRLVRWFSSGLRDGSGKVTAMLSIGHDITDAQQERERLQQAYKNEAIARLTGGVAHDFNNQLAVVKGYSDLLLRELDAKNPVRQPLEQIQKAAERSAGLVRQLLAYSRKQVLKSELTNLGEVLTELSGPLQLLLGKAVTLTTRTDQDLGIVSVDRAQLQQSLMNLSANARDAMPDGGQLTIELENVDLDMDYVSRHNDATAGPHVRLTLRDSGYGMDAETLSKLFEPFFTTKPEGQGTGLGLAMTYGFIRQSGGHVTVESAPGKGATFQIYLPRVDGGSNGR